MNLFKEFLEPLELTHPISILRHKISDNRFDCTIYFNLKNLLYTSYTLKILSVRCTLTITFILFFFISTPFHSTLFLVILKYPIFIYTSYLISLCISLQLTLLLFLHFTFFLLTC